MTYRGGVPNLAQVDANVYRSGQITTAEGWDTIAVLAAGRHIHVIKLNFDDEGSDAIAAARGYDVQLLAIQPAGDRGAWSDVVDVFRQPDAATVDRAELVLSTAAALVSTDFYLVHCTHGQDRTGYVIGRHRVQHEGWSKARAYDEMRAHHFHPELHGIHEAWEHF